MSATTYAAGEPSFDLELPDKGALASLASSLGWVGMSGLTVTAVALFGMALAVVGAIGTVVVAAIALVCVLVGAAVLAAALLVIAGLLVAGGALALAIGVAAGTLAALFGVGAWAGKAIGMIFARFGELRSRRSLYLQPSKSSSA